jgi:hypothetical protein
VGGKQKMMSSEMLPILPKLPNAACREYEFPNVFFPESKKQEADCLPFVQSICGGCIERKECLEFALDQQIPHGIWAGTTPTMRKLIRDDPKAAGFATSVAARIRNLSNKGKSPQQIAVLLSIQVAYVNLALSRTAKNKGEIQLLITTKNLLDESSLSSESA